MRLLVVVQARQGSARLPGKTLLQLGGKTMLEWVLHRVRQAFLPATVVVATSTDRGDDPIQALCDRLGVRVFRGHPTDLLDRFYRCAHQHPDTDVIVRVTADCPLLCPTLLSETVWQLGGAAYSGVQGAPNGLGQECFTVQALEQAWTNTVDTHDREHVVPYMLDRLPARMLDWRGPTIDTSFALDTGQDLIRLVQLYDRFGDALFWMDGRRLVACLGDAIASARPGTVAAGGQTRGRADRDA